MFNNVETKIKKYIKFLTIFSIVLLILFALILTVLTYGGIIFFSPAFLIIGFGIMLTGLFLYAFAELLEQSKLQTQLLIEIKKQLENI